MTPASGSLVHAYKPQLLPRLSYVLAIFLCTYKPCWYFHDQFWSWSINKGIEHLQFQLNLT